MTRTILILTVLSFFSPLQAQELVWTADYPIQDFQRMDATATFDVLYRKVERNRDTSSRQLQIEIQVGLQIIDRPQLAFAPNTEVVRYDRDRLITLSNARVDLETGGKLELYQIGADSLTLLRRWVTRNGAKLGVVEPFASLDYLIVTDSDSQNPPNRFYLLDSNLQVRYAGPNFSQGFSWIDAQERAGVLYVSCVSGDGYLYWYGFEVATGQVCSMGSLPVGGLHFYELYFLGDRLCYLFNDPVRQQFGLRVCTLSGQLQAEFWRPEAMMGFFLFSDRLMLRSRSLQVLEFNPLDGTLTAKVDLLDQLQKRYPALTQVASRIYYHEIQEMVVNDGRDRLIAIPLAALHMPGINQLVVLVFNSEWEVQQHYLLEGDAEQYRLKMEADGQVYCAFGNKIYRISRHQKEN